MNWISIETSFPSVNEEVLITELSGKVRDARYCGDDRWASIPGGHPLYVIGWAKMPAAFEDASARLRIAKLLAGIGNG